MRLEAAAVGSAALGASMTELLMNAGAWALAVLMVVRAASSAPDDARWSADVRGMVTAPLRAIGTEATLFPAFAASVLVGFRLGARRET